MGDSKRLESWQIDQLGLGNLQLQHISGININGLSMKATVTSMVSTHSQDR